MLRILYKGCVPYRDALALQEALHALRVRGEIPDTLLLLEHPPVFTTGRQEVEDDWLLSHDEIRARGIEIVATGRGGRITYHGLGQLVGYFVCDLQTFSRATRGRGAEGGGIAIPDFIQWIEDGIITVLSRYGIAAHSDPEHPGVWVGREKIAAIGLHIRHFVTMHGFALNVTTDLAPYACCIPCGIRDRGVTRLATLQPGRNWSVPGVARDVGDYFSITKGLALPPPPPKANKTLPQRRFRG